MIHKTVCNSVRQFRRVSTRNDALIPSALIVCIELFSNCYSAFPYSVIATALVKRLKNKCQAEDIKEYNPVKARVLNWHERGQSALPIKSTPVSRCKIQFRICLFATLLLLTK